MKHFIYFSKSAITSGNLLSKAKGNLMKAGRMDIVIHSLIATFFLSHSVRENVKLHLIFYGPPDAPKHIEIQVNDELEISKKDIANLIKKILYKYKPGKKTQPLKGCFIEKKSFLKVVEELIEEGKEIFILDKKGKDIRKINIPEDSVFIVGDQEGLPKKELKKLKKITEKISIGPKTYFASQTITILNNELDRRNL